MFHNFYKHHTYLLHILENNSYCLYCKNIGTNNVINYELFLSTSLSPHGHTYYHSFIHSFIHFFCKSFTRYGNSHFYNSTSKITTYSIYIQASVVQRLACWPLVPEFAGSNPAEAVGFFGRKNPQHAFLRRGSKAVGPMS